MEANESLRLPGMIIQKIFLEKKKYSQALKSNKEFSELKEIRLKIHRLLEELKVLLPEARMTEPAY